MNNHDRIENFLQKASEICTEYNATVIGIEHNDDITTVEFKFFSPQGRDFTFSIDIDNTIEDFDDFVEIISDETENYADEFDVSYETYIWLDNFGHGKNGAPYDMKDCYNDTEWCMNKIYLLADEFRKLEWVEQ